MGQVVNWLSSVRLYLDHMETDLKRRFARDSPEIERFKEITGEPSTSRLLTGSSTNSETTFSIVVCQ